MPTNAGLFSITRFLYGGQKIFTNKNISSKGDIHVLIRTFFSKIYYKNIIYDATFPLSTWGRKWQLMEDVKGMW